MDRNVWHPGAFPPLSDQVLAGMRVYNRFAVLAFLVGTIVLVWQLRRDRATLWYLLPLPLALFFVTRAGAALLYAAETGMWETSWLRYASPQRSGLSYYGGFYVAAVIIATHAYVAGTGVWRTLDLFSAPAAFGYAVGRLGCLFGGCCGSQWSVPAGWGLGAFLSEHAAFPVQALDSALAFTIGAILLRIPLERAGSRCAWLLVLLGCARIAVDFGRDTRAVVFGLSTVDVLSIPLVVVGLLMIRARRRRRLDSRVTPGAGRTPALLAACASLRR
jgi:prolipoprotein diacylglyceryltransferase